MTLTLGTGPFGPASAGQFNFERRGPAHVLYWEDWPARMRGVLGDTVVVDSRRTKVLHETGLLPVHYFREADVRIEHLRATDHTTQCPFKGDASYWLVSAGGKELDNAVWSYPKPLEGAPPLAGYLAFSFDRLDHWL